MSANANVKQIPSSICAPLGFSCASVFCDIKKLGTGQGSEKGRKDDLALIISEVPAVVAAMFTTNQVCAAPVKVSRSVAAKQKARAIVVNSGNANACTGAEGFRDAKRMAKMAAEYISSSRAGKLDRINRSSSEGARCVASEVLVCSTGRIGVRMPMENVELGIRACAPLVERSSTKARMVAEAIMTTDTRRKEMAVEFQIGDRKVRIGGICKGAGMIQPGMATMLAFITTDIAIAPTALKKALKFAVGESFNRITVDGDMSTNDSVIVLANGLARNSKFEIRNSKFQETLNFVCLELAKMIVRDGEGTSRVIRVIVRGARSSRDAELAARSIATSSLVRTSWCGGDPNWGRVLCALGYSKAKVNESLVDIGYASPDSREIGFAFRRGRPSNLGLRKLASITCAREFSLYVDLHLGSGEFTMFATDLTEEYVSLNKGDVNDPETLGG